MDPRIEMSSSPPTFDDLPSFEPDPNAGTAEHVAAVEPVRARSWIARSSRGLEILSYEGCEAALRHDGLLPGIQKQLVKMGLSKDDLVGASGGSMLLSEGENHLRLHRVVSRWFTPKRIEQIRDRVTEYVRGLVQPMTDAGGGDFMDQLARRLPGPVFCWMIGADPAMGDRLYAMSEILLRAFTGDPTFAEAIGKAAGEMRVFVDELIEAKRSNPGDDLMTIMLEAADAGDLSIDDVHTLAFEMLSASTDNTANAAGLAIWVLCRHPEQWQVLHADPAGVAPAAVEECTRYEPRVRYGQAWNPRTATLLGLEIPPDSMMFLDIVSAHHDPNVFPDPTRFDVTRQHARPQLNFGTGRHYCLGAALARMELQVVLGTVSTAWSTISLAGEPVLPRGIDRSVKHLPISITV